MFDAFANYGRTLLEYEIACIEAGIEPDYNCHCSQNHYPSSSSFGWPLLFASMFF